MSISIRKRMAVAFPGKEILIGETGWPSAGRMREGALPSRTNQARVVSEILDLAKKEGFRVNLIEAYDQPWKRQLEGTVGGYWGLFDAGQAGGEISAGRATSATFRAGSWQMGCGMALSFFIFLAAWLTLRRRPWKPRLTSWIAVGVSGDHRPASCSALPPTRCFTRATASAAGCNGARCWRPAIAAPLLVAHALDVGTAAADASWNCSVPRDVRTRSLLSVLLGIALIVTTLIAAETALGFTFDPRYRDFPFAVADHGGGAVRAADAAEPAAGGRAPDRRDPPLPACSWSRRSIPASTRAPRTGSRCGPARSISLLALTLWRARAAQSPK